MARYERRNPYRPFALALSSEYANASRYLLLLFHVTYMKRNRGGRIYRGAIAAGLPYSISSRLAPIRAA